MNCHPLDRPRHLPTGKHLGRVGRLVQEAESGSKRAVRTREKAKNRHLRESESRACCFNRHALVVSLTPRIVRGTTEMPPVRSRPAYLIWSILSNPCSMRACSRMSSLLTLILGRYSLN